jgi:hypothetical protein
MSRETKLEALAAEFGIADEEFARLSARLAQATLDFDSRKLTAPTAEYGKLKDAAEQARLRADAAKRVRDQKLAALETAREVEQRRLTRELAERSLREKEQELTALNVTLRERRDQLKALMALLPRLENERNAVLRALNTARLAANALGAAA